MKNSNILIKFLIFSSIALLFTSCTSSKTTKLMTRDLSVKNTGLIFPYKDGSQVDYFYCFGLFPWNPPENTETHGGIDIIPKYSAGPKPKMYQMVAVTDMKLYMYVKGKSEHGYKSFMQIWALSPNWYVIYNFEPQNDYVSDLQKENMITQIGTKVKKGENIGKLVVYGFLKDKYPHIHYALLYKSPTDTFKKLFNNPISIAVSDGSYLPGLSSLFNPKDIGLPSMFFCPYVYSDSKAKKIFKSRKAYNTKGQSCSSICAYESRKGDCGRGWILDKIGKE